MRVRRQRGTYLTEFAIVASVVFTAIFAVLEVARLMYTYNVLTEASRRSARLAAVCAPNNPAGVPSVYEDLKSLALFDGTTLVKNLTNDNLTIDYLDKDGASALTYSAISLVRASISDYQHQLLIPGFFITLNAPTFVTILPRESLGATRFGITTICS
ncbi:TadE/TadG family type IV pilus assembly protein [Ferrimonas pelagia]|uniref:TadE-like domain-containing protein n=1 Tax=Ferrimonas pelagia TaxID=1177826 RepID=A0ABP9EI23_9GAMM